jgi:hypothetical protein
MASRLPISTEMGSLDLAVTNACGNAESCTPLASGSITLLRGKGDGTFWSGSQILTDYHNPQGIAAADLNGDGLADLVITGFTESNGLILFGDGKGRFPNMVCHASQRGIAVRGRG